MTKAAGGHGGKGKGKAPVDDTTVRKTKRARVA
jgi:hypothetical protein